MGHSGAHVREAHSHWTEAPRVLRGLRVSMMEPAEVRDTGDVVAATLNDARQRRVAVQGQVRARLVVERGDRLPPIARS